MTLPNFILFGSARSGSTALHEYISQHPDVFMSEPKEPHFFAFEGERVAFRGPGDELMMNRTAITDLAAYERLFARAGNARMIGEGSISYLYYPRSIERIKRYTPEARLICILRNPVDRAHSAFGFMRARMFEPLESFEDALAQEEWRISQNWHHIWHYQRMGYYFAQLKPYFDAFPRDQIRVHLFDDLRRDPLAVVQDCYRFLGVDYGFVPPDTPSTVLGGEPRNRSLHRALMGVWALKGVVRPLLPFEFRRKLWRRLNNGNLRKVSVAPETRERLTRDYRDDLLRLQDLIGRDLSAWLKPRVARETRPQVSAPAGLGEIPPPLPRP